MARRKTAMRLIENARERAARYAKRTRGIQKMASELSMLCAVPVALVCAPAAGAPASVVWESEEGVIDRYRAAAFPPETRARHTHRSYLEAELGKAKAKLAKARHGTCRGALADWDPALDDMTVDEAREMLQTIDTTLRAARDRMVALGLPAVDEQVTLAPGDGASHNAAAVEPQQLGLEDKDMGACFQMQLVPWHGGNNDGGGGGGSLLEQFLWDDSFPMQPGYGLECVGSNYDVDAVDDTHVPAGYVGSNYDVGAVDDTHVPAGYGDNADCGWPDLTMCYAADGGSWDAAMTVGFYPDFADGALAPEHYAAAQDVTGRDYIDTLPLQYAMGMHQNQNLTNLDNSCTAQWQAEEFQTSDINSGMDENYPYLDNSCTAQWHAEEFQPSDTNSSMDENYAYLDNSYAAHWQAEEFQPSGAGTGHYQDQCSDPRARNSGQIFNYPY